MKFMLMGFEAKGEWERLPQAERDQRVQRHQQALQELIAERGFVDGRTLVLTSVGLAHSAEAITLRTEGGRFIADEVRYVPTARLLSWAGAAGRLTVPGERPMMPAIERKHGRGHVSRLHSGATGRRSCLFRLRCCSAPSVPALRACKRAGQ